jgi:hypothetical protein
MQAVLDAVYHLQPWGARRPVVTAGNTMFFRKSTIVVLLTAFQCFAGYDASGFFGDTLANEVVADFDARRARLDSASLARLIETAGTLQTGQPYDHTTQNYRGRSLLCPMSLALATI